MFWDTSARTEKAEEGRMVWLSWVVEVLFAIWRAIAWLTLLLWHSITKPILNYTRRPSRPLNLASRWFPLLLFMRVPVARFRLSISVINGLRRYNQSASSPPSITAGIRF